MKNSELLKVQKAEADFWDVVAEHRIQKGLIPMEADIRKATKYIPQRKEKLPLIDPKLASILDDGAREKYLDMVAYTPGGRVLDICCGAGWLSLELARRGQVVDAYDLSPKAISLAKKTLKANPFKKGFGKVNYHVGDVSKIDLGFEKYDAVSGWAAFHHLPDPPNFLEKVNQALKPGGIVATYDDLHMGKFEKALELLLRFILPQIHHSYLDKLSFLKGLIIGKKFLPEEGFSPMEEAKHFSVEDITKIFNEKFNVIWMLQRNAFVGTPVVTLAGSDSFRYTVARILVLIDKLFCRIRIVRGFDQIIIAKKK